MNQVILCTPKKVYTNMNAQEAAESYIDNTLKDFNEIIDYDKNFNEFEEYKEILTFEEKIEGNKNLTLLFQRIKQIAELKRKFTSTIYFFNPICKETDLALPDLNIIEIVGNDYEVSCQFSKFYRSKGWDVEIITPMSLRRRELNQDTMISSIYEPNDLIQLAIDHLDYDPYELCFDKKN